MSKILLLLLCCSKGFSQSLPMQLDTMMQRSFAEDQPGAALLVAKDGKVLYAKGFGLADMVDGKQQKITAATNFRMASVSKQFTAMCILLLEQQHKLSYEDKLLKFFPVWNKKVAATVTVKQLLNHSSGIWDYEDLIPATRQDQVSDADVVNYLLAKDTVYFKVGSAFRYSNSGFCVLEQIVEKVSGKDYGAYCEQYIFKPLGMTNTSIYQREKIIKHRAMGFAKNEKDELQAADQSITSATKGDGGVYTSLNDYLKWANWLTNNKKLDFFSHLNQINCQIEGTAQINYGMGWFNKTRDKSQTALYHTGSTCGFSSVVKIVPEGKLIIDYFSNIADNHAVFYEAESILKNNRIGTGQNFKKMIELTQ